LHRTEIIRLIEVNKFLESEGHKLRRCLLSLLIEKSKFHLEVSAVKLSPPIQVHAPQANHLKLRGYCMYHQF